MSDDFFDIPESNKAELIETKIDIKNIPRRVSITYELTIPKEENKINDGETNISTKDKNISKEEGEAGSKNLSG